MFGQIRPTPYDVTFSINRIPVRIVPTFWLGAAILNWRELTNAPELMILWILCVMVSILLHEMGHALVQQFFGYWPHVVLHHFGGYAAYQPDSRMTWWKSLLISAAGPGAQLLLFGLVLLYFNFGMGWKEDYRIQAIVEYLYYINLFWPIFNLVPIYPLDGGRIAEALFQKFTPYNAFRYTRILSIATCVICLFLTLTYMRGVMLLPIFFVIFGMQNYQELTGKRGW